ncbi:glycine cleavage system transcriptional repressor, partial [Klebsiella pneumoniae]
MLYACFFYAFLKNNSPLKGITSLTLSS